MIEVVTAYEDPSHTQRVRIVIDTDLIPGGMYVYHDNVLPKDKRKGYVISSHRITSDREWIMRDWSNCRRIIMILKDYQ